MNEQWRTVYERWEVSNYGRVRNKNTLRQLRVRLRKDGYLDVKLSYKRYLVHRLVAQAFLPNPLRMAQVNHLDGIRHNAALTNLEWCNQSANMRHALKMGLFADRKGEANGRATINYETAQLIKQLLLKAKPMTVIAKQVGVSYHVVANIKRGHAWK